MDYNTLINNQDVMKMQNFIQHGDTTTYEHCINVVKASMDISKLLHIDVDKDTLITGAMLHDFYLYDWHKFDNGEHKLHGYTHADKSVYNAKKYFNINKNIEHVIWCHMWPLNITRIPKTKEAWIVCLADKYVSVRETIHK